MRLRVYPVTVSSGMLWWKTYSQRFAVQELQDREAPRLMSLDSTKYKSWVSLTLHPTVVSATLQRDDLLKANNITEEI